MSKNCNHPTCMDSEECRRPKKEKKVYQLKRTPIKKKSLPKGDINTLTQNELLKVAQNAVNAYVRNRDKDKGCICGCGKRVDQAGHLFPAGSYSGVRYDADNNIFGISKACNYYKRCPAIDPEAEAEVIAKIGMAAFLRLKEVASKTRNYKWEREELINIILKFKAK